MSMVEQRGAIQDSVHGIVRISKLEYSLLQSPFLRRLHDIKQLGLAYLVFPSATHSRLEHSLGVMHVAHRMAKRVIEVTRRKDGICERLFESCDDAIMDSFVQVARLAGMLHDLGHLPFSHMGEQAVESIVSKISSLEGVRRSIMAERKIHETYTKFFIEKMLERRKGPEADYIALTLASLYGGSEERLGLKREALGVVRSIISGEIVDADRMDYLVRDARYTGVVYGYIDIERIVESLELRISGSGVALDIPPKAMQAIEDLYDARYKMYKTVYYHHKLGALSNALARVMEHATDHYEILGVESLEDLLMPDRLSELISEGKLYFDDSELWFLIKHVSRRGSEAARRWADALLHERHLLPISLVKRWEEIYHVIERGGAGPADLSAVKAVIGVLMDKEMGERIEEELRRRWPEVKVDKSSVLIVGSSKSSGEERGEYESHYLKYIMNVASVQPPMVYAYAESREDHKRLYEEREHLRAAFKELIVKLTLESLKQDSSRSPHQGSHEH